MYSTNLIPRESKSVKMMSNQGPKRLPLLLLSSLAFVASGVVGGEYLIGVGSHDSTGPAADVNMMGYGNMQQNSAGIHFRLRARAFVVAESPEGTRFAFVNLDAGMASQLVVIKVLERLRSRFGDSYTEENVAISGTHTHSGPGGYLQYVLYIVTSLGFVQQSFNAIVDAVEQSIVQAHHNLKPGSIFIDQGDVHGAGISRSPSAYLLNPAEERARYTADVDTRMTLLKFVDGESEKSIGAFNWFATHGTSMSRDNLLISGDNKGAAARFFEDWYRSASGKGKPVNRSDVGGSSLAEKVQTIGPTGGKPCGKTSSRSSKVRMNDGSLFVAAFCQSNVGDVSPNVLGAFCTDTGKPCDFNRSSCHGDDTLCVGRGPGYPDEILSTKIIGERQFKTALELFQSANEELTGKIDHRHAYVNFTDVEVELRGNRAVKTCPAALGAGFAAGTTDGPGQFGFQQGDTEINPFWKLVRDMLTKPSAYQEECQKPKPVLLSTGEMFDPYAWAPAILPIQMLRLGQLIILSVPGEFTTMAGRRLREAVKETLVSNGKGEFREDLQVVIAGLTNTYSQYVATFEEYAQQRYEDYQNSPLCEIASMSFPHYSRRIVQAASTLYGPHTLSAYIQEFKKLAKAMATGDKVPARGPSPPDLSSVQLSLLLPPPGGSPPPGVNFGDMKEDVGLPGSKGFKTGDRVNATFWSADPRHDLLTEGTFAVVEKLEGGRWIPVHDDDDFCLFFKWKPEGNGLYGSATIEWEVPEEAKPGIYRFRHYGSSQKIFSPTEYFTGASSAFTVS